MAGKVSEAAWRTKEFWVAGTPANCQISLKALEEKYAETGREGWNYRRRTAKNLNRREGWGITFKEFVNGSKNPDGDPVAPKAQEPVFEMTLEQILQRDKMVIRVSAERDDFKRRYQASSKMAELEERLIARMEEVVPRLMPFAPSFPPVVKSGKLSKEKVVVQISDWHFGEIVSEEETGGLGSYSFDVAARRLQHLVDQTLNIVFNNHAGSDIRDMVIFMLGDMISGIIHEELVEAGEETVMEWLLYGSHLFAQAIRELSAYFDSIEVACVVGNHGRLQKQYRFKKKYVGWDYLFYHFLAMELADVENVKFDIPRSFWLMKKIEGWNFIALHGDNVKSWAGIPWYGIQRMEAKFTALLASESKFFDYMLLGHFHNSGDLDRVKGEILLNGSAVGGNEFSIGALTASSAPKQWLFGVHEREGVSWRYPLNLKHGDAIENCRYHVGNPLEVH